MAGPTKRCCACGHAWPATREYFRGMSKAPGGLHYECKACHAERVAEYRRRPEVAARERARRRTRAYREEKRAYRAAYNAANAARVKRLAGAHYLRFKAQKTVRARLRRALASGRIARPATCRACGGPPVRRLFAHLEDGRPLEEARFYCEACYAGRRRPRNREIATDASAWALLHAENVARLEAEETERALVAAAKGPRYAWLWYLYLDLPEGARRARVERILAAEERA